MFGLETAFLFKRRRVTDQGNDILLIRLESPVVTFLEDGNYKVMPVCLPQTCRMIFVRH